MTRLRSLSLLVSFCLHGGLAGILLFISAGRPVETERIYTVALAEFAQPDIVREAPSPESPAPAAGPEPSPGPEFVAPPPGPAPEPGKKPENKTVRARKPAPPARPAPASPAARQSRPRQEPSPAQTAPGPQPRQIGGLSAYDQDHLDQRPFLSRRVEPEYPARAKQMRIEGAVTVELVVDAAGLPRSCAVRSAEPPGYFEEAALKAAREMRFSPGKIKGVPVNTLVRLPFAFRLR
ncbi:MAG: TonB family protein [Desulfovibrio sp.]|nr:TonB family protein [Desulfovibrio sp.]